MREIFSLVLMIFFLSSLSCGGQEKVSYLDFPDGLSWDFGRAREEGDELVHSYRFTNASRDTVTIVNINVFCKCTRAAASARTFLPGESGEIRVGFSHCGYHSPPETCGGGVSCSAPVIRTAFRQDIV